MIIFSINKQTSEPAIARPSWVANSVAPAEIDAAQQISIKSDQKSEIDVAVVVARGVGDVRSWRG
jgi:hypothetical protein